MELMPIRCVLGVPVEAGLTADSVIVQLPPPGALPAPTVTLEGDGVETPAAKFTLVALAVHPPEMEMLALTAPSVPPVRVTENVVEPVETGMLVAVPLTLSAS